MGAELQADTWGTVGERGSTTWTTQAGEVLRALTRTESAIGTVHTDKEMGGVESAGEGAVCTDCVCGGGASIQQRKRCVRWEDVLVS